MFLETNCEELADDQQDSLETPTEKPDEEAEISEPGNLDVASLPGKSETAPIARKKKSKASNPPEKTLSSSERLSISPTRNTYGRTTRRLTLVGGAPKKDVTRRLTLVPGGAPKKDVDVGDEGEPSHRIRLVQWNEVTDSNSRKTVPRVKKVSKGKKEKRPQKTATQSKASITRRDISVGGGSGRNNEKKRRRI